jgi:hypothetical protein
MIAGGFSKEERREESPDSEAFRLARAWDEAARSRDRVVQGNAPGNARGLRVEAGEGSRRWRGYGKCHRKANRR